MFEKHIIVPYKSPPCYYLSLENFNCFRAGLHFYSCLTWKSRIKKNLLCVGYPLLKISRIWSRKKEWNELETVLPEFFKRVGLVENTVNMYLPSNNAAIIKDTDKVGKCLRIFKLAIIRGSDSLLEEEASHVRFIQNLTLSSFESPKVIRECKTDNFAFIEYSCPRNYTPLGKIDCSIQIINVLNELFHANKIKIEQISDTTVFKKIKNNLGTIAVGEARQLCQDVLATYESGTFRYINVPLGIVHYDFKPWNLLINKETNKLFVVDWELMSKNGLPLWDAFSYTLFTFFVLKYDVTPEKKLYANF